MRKLWDLEECVAVNCKKCFSPNITALLFILNSNVQAEQALE